MSEEIIHVPMEFKTQEDFIVSHLNKCQFFEYDYIPELKGVINTWREKAKKLEESLNILKSYFDLEQYGSEDSNSVYIRFYEGEYLSDKYHEEDFIKLVQILDLKTEEEE